MVIANLDGQVEKIFRLKVEREHTGRPASVEAEPMTNARAMEALNPATSEGKARVATPDEGKNSDSFHVASQKENTAAALDDAGLPIWLL